MLPETSDTMGWSAIEELVLGQDDLSTVEDLEIQGVLAGEDDWPSYGHSTRHEAALAWFTRDSHGIRYGRQEAGPLIESLRQKVRRAEIDAERYRFVGILARTFQNVGQLKLREDVSMAGTAALVAIKIREDLKRQSFWESFGRGLGDILSGVEDIGSEMVAAEQTVYRLAWMIELTWSDSDSGVQSLCESDGDVKILCAEIIGLLAHIAEHTEPEERDSMLAEIEEVVAKMELTSVTGDWSSYVAALQDADPRAWAVPASRPRGGPDRTIPREFRAARDILVHDSPDGASSGRRRQPCRQR